MKDYFKYRNGYINIDDENLYITSSGNWQEARELKEKNPKTKRKNFFRILWNNFFLFLIMGGAMFGAYRVFEEKGAIILGLIVVLPYFIQKYFQNEMGKRYRIPLAKIEAVEKFDKGLKIIFRNETNEPDFEIIDDVEPKGFEILSSLDLIAAKN